MLKGQVKSKAMRNCIVVGTKLELSTLPWLGIEDVHV
jgi:hypothetical protein